MRKRGSFLRENKAIFLVLIVCICMLSLFALRMPVTEWDENAYLANARSHLGIAHYTEEFRFPLLEFMISSVWSFTGENIVVIRMMMILFYAALIYIFYLTLREFAAEKTALIGAIAFGLSSLMVYFGFRIYTDIMALFFAMFSFYIIIISKRSRNPMLMVSIAGFAAGLSFLSRFTMALFPIIAGAFMLKERRFKDLLFYAGGCFAVLLPWMLYNLLVYHNPLWELLEQYKIVAQYTSPGSALAQLMNLAANIGPLIALLVPAAIFLLKKSKKDRSKDELKKWLWLALVYIAVYSIYITFFANIKIQRYLFAFIGFLYLVFFVGLDYMLNNWKRALNTLAVSLIICWIIASLAITIGKISSDIKCGDKGAKLESIKYMSESTKPGNDIISNEWPLYGYYNNLRVHSYWADIPTLIREHNPVFFIYNSLVGGESKKELDAYSANGVLNLEKTIYGKCNEIIYIYRLKNAE